MMSFKVLIFLQVTAEKSISKFGVENSEHDEAVIEPNDRRHLDSPKYLPTDSTCDAEGKKVAGIVPEKISTVE